MGMLVLERYEGQGIRVDDHILITAIEIFPGEGGRDAFVKIGVMAPKDRTILREEIWNENQVTKAGIDLNEKEAADAAD